MKIASTGYLIAALGAVSLLFSGAAQAHTGHGTAGLAEGLAHPFGLDHLLAMVAVGIWSVAALPAKRAFIGPLVFLTALMVSAVLGVLGMTMPHLEGLIAASVVLFGLMLVTSRSPLSANLGLLWIALAASLHGLAHGAETPASGFAGYAVGFLVTTAALHACGVGVALGIRRHFDRRASGIIHVLGVAFGGAGVYLLGQI